MSLIYGQLVKAQLENLSADPTGKTGLIYFNTSSNIFKWYNGSGWLTGVDTSTAQTLSSKTIASGIVTTALTFNAQAELRLADSDSSNYVGFKSPGTVAANKVWILPNTDSTGTQALVSDGSLNLSWASIVTDPMTTRGDLLYRNASNVNDRLPVGAANRILKSDGTDPSWGLLVNANVDAAAAIAYSKLNLATSIVNADISASAAIAGSKLQAASDTNVGTLNYYKENTSFTPTWTTSGTNFSSVTYTTQSGRYTRVGNTVTFTLRVDVSSVTVGSASGALTVGGLPHASASPVETIVHVKSNNVDYSGSPTGGAWGSIASGATTINIGANVDNGSYVDALAASNGGATARYLIISGSYLV